MRLVLFNLEFQRDHSVTNTSRSDLKDVFTISVRIRVRVNICCEQTLSICHTADENLMNIYFYVLWCSLLLFVVTEFWIVLPDLKLAIFSPFSFDRKKAFICVAFILCNWIVWQDSTLLCTFSKHTSSSSLGMFFCLHVFLI